MTSSPRRTLSAFALILGVVAACGTPEVGIPAAAPPLATSASNGAAPALSEELPGPSSGSTAGSTAPPASSSSSKPPAPPVAGKVVVLDPGHNGGNASNPAQITKQVPAGRGQMKACNTTGTATNAGYSEHEFTWDVSLRVRDALAAKGIKVVMTRQNDTGVGPCVDARAAVGNQSGAAAVVSIHADGATSPGAHGFHVAYSAPPLNAAQGEPSTRLARTVRDGLSSAGFATSTYIGSKGLSPRADLGGLNLSERPIVLVECGNMRNPDEAAVFASPTGRQRYADAIAAAIVSYVAQA